MSSLSPLAIGIYRHLVRCARAGKGVTYGELAKAVAAHPRSSVMHGALTEVARACRRAHLPCLPALVWRSGTGRPAVGYYAVAHPRALTEAARRHAWQRERARAVAEVASYPPVLAGVAGRGRA